MNKHRRKEIENLIKALDDCITDAESIRDDEQEYFDNMPENFQIGEKGEAAEFAVGELDEVVTGLEAAKEQLEGIE